MATRLALRCVRWREQKGVRALVMCDLLFRSAAVTDDNKEEPWYAREQWHPVSTILAPLARQLIHSRHLDSIEMSPCNKDVPKCMAVKSATHPLWTLQVDLSRNHSKSSEDAM